MSRRFYSAKSLYNKRKGLVTAIYNKYYKSPKAQAHRPLFLKEEEHTKTKCGVFVTVRSAGIEHAYAFSNRYYQLPVGDVLSNQSFAECFAIVESIVIGSVVANYEIACHNSTVVLAGLLPVAHPFAIAPAI